MPLQRLFRSGVIKFVCARLDGKYFRLHETYTVTVAYFPLFSLSPCKNVKTALSVQFQQRQTAGEVCVLGCLAVTPALDPALFYLLHTLSPSRITLGIHELGGVGLSHERVKHGPGAHLCCLVQRLAF